jgi:hypothetical protein
MCLRSSVSTGLPGPVGASLVVLALVAATPSAVRADSSPCSQAQLDEIAKLQAELQANGASYSVACNPSLADRTMAELTGLHVPASFADVFKARVQPIDSTAGSTLPSSFNWGLLHDLTPIKDQQYCSSCWAMTVNEVVEEKIKILTGLDTNLSSQYLISCDRQYFGCAGGFWAFDYYIDAFYPPQTSAGTVREEDFTFGGGAPLTCPANPLPTTYQLDSWHFVDTADGVAGGLPTVQAIKHALFEHGPLAVGICADPLHYYYGGIIDGDTQACGTTRDIHSANHAVTIVGWVDDRGPDDGYWIVQNSWGPSFGETIDGVPVCYFCGGHGGYFRIRYGLANVGVAAAFVEMKDPSPPPILPKVNVIATGDAQELGSVPGSFTVARTGDPTASLTVRYTLAGTARSGVDYVKLGGSVTIPAGAINAIVTVTPIPQKTPHDNETVALALVADPGYESREPSSATLTLFAAPTDATLRPVVGPVTPSSVVPGSTSTLSATYSSSNRVKQCVLLVDGAFIGGMRLHELTGVPGKVLGTASIDWKVPMSMPATMSAEVTCINGYNASGTSTTVLLASDTQPPEVGAADFLSSDTFGFVNAPNVIALGYKDEWHAGFTDQTGVSACHFYVDGVDVGAMTLDCDDAACTSGSGRIEYAFTTLGDHTAQARCWDADHHGIGAGTTVPVTVELLTPHYTIELDPQYFPVMFGIPAFRATTLTFHITSPGPVVGCRYQDEDFGFVSGSYGNDTPMTISTPSYPTATATATVVYGDLSEDGGFFLEIRPTVTCWDDTHVSQVLLDNHLFADAVQIRTTLPLSSYPQQVLLDLRAEPSPIRQGSPAVISADYTAPGAQWPLDHCTLTTPDGSLHVPGTLSDAAGLHGTVSFTIPETYAYGGSTLEASIQCYLRNVFGPPHRQCSWWYGCGPWYPPELSPVTLTQEVAIDTTSAPVPVFDVGDLSPRSVTDIDAPTTFTLPYHAPGGLVSCTWKDERVPWYPWAWDTFPNQAAVSDPSRTDGTITFQGNLDLGTALIEILCLANDGSKHYLGDGEVPGGGWAGWVPGLVWDGGSIAVDVSDGRAMSLDAVAQAPDPAAPGRALFLTTTYHAPRGARSCSLQYRHGPGWCDNPQTQNQCYWYTPAGVDATLSSPDGTDGIATAVVLPPAQLDPSQDLAFACWDGRFMAYAPIAVSWEQPGHPPHLFSELRADPIPGTNRFDIRVKVSDVRGILACDLLAIADDPTSGAPMTLDDPGASLVDASIDAVAPTEVGDPDRFAVSCTDAALNRLTKVLEVPRSGVLGTIDPQEITPGQAASFSVAYDLTVAPLPDRLVGLPTRTLLPDHVLHFDAASSSDVALGAWDPVAPGGQMTWHVRLRMSNPDATNTMALVMKSGDAWWTGPMYGLYLSYDWGSGYYPCFMKFVPPYSWEQTCASTPIAKDAWVSLAVSYDDATRNVKLYIDGQPAGAATFATWVSALAQTARPLKIGKWSGFGDYYDFTGEISDVLMFNVVQPDDVVAQYAGGAAVAAGDPTAVATYTMTDPPSASTTWIDGSGHGHDGTPHNLTLVRDYYYAPFAGLAIESCSASINGVDLGAVAVAGQTTGTLALGVPAGFDWLGPTGAADASADSMALTLSCTSNANLCPDWCIPDGWTLQSCSAAGYCPRYVVGASAGVTVLDPLAPTVTAIAPTSYTLGAAATISAGYDDASGVVSCSLAPNGGASEAMALSAPGGASGTASFDVPIGYAWPNAGSYLDSGYYAASVVCTDAAGRQGGRGAALTVGPPAPAKVVVGAIAPVTATAESAITFTASYAGGVGVDSCFLLLHDRSGTISGGYENLGAMVLSAPNGPVGVASFTVPADHDWYSTANSDDYYNYADPTQTVVVACIDALGRQSSSSATVLVNRPDRPPQQLGLSTDFGTATNSNVLDFGMSIVEESAVVELQCSLDGGPFTTCPASDITKDPSTTWTFSGATEYGGLADGVHTLQFRAVDDGGLVSAPSDPVSWLIDTQAPVISINGDPAQVAFYDRDGDGLPDSLLLFAVDPPRAPAAESSGIGLPPTYTVAASSSGLSDLDLSAIDWGYWFANDASLVVPLAIGTPAWAGSLLPYAGQATFTASTSDMAGNIGQAAIAASLDKCPDAPGAADHAGCPTAVRATVSVRTVTKSGTSTVQPLAGAIVDVLDTTDPGFSALYGTNSALWASSVIYEHELADLLANDAFAPNYVDFQYPPSEKPYNNQCVTDAGGACASGFARTTPGQALVLAKMTDPFTGLGRYARTLVAASEFDATRLATARPLFTICDTTRGDCPFSIQPTVTLQVSNLGSPAAPAAPVAGAAIRVFDLSDPAFVGRYGSDLKSILYPTIFESVDTTVPSMAECVTGADGGSCNAWFPLAPTKSYLVLVRLADAGTGKTVYAGTTVQPGQFKDLNHDGIKEIATPNVAIIQVMKDGVLEEYRGASGVSISCD